jgi:hypothetical protein
MISLAARRRQAREFARAVEAETPEVRSELVDPLQVVTLLRDAPPIEPDPAFVSRLRDELLSAAAARAEELHSADEGPDDDLARRRVRSPRHQRLLAIAASTLVIVGAGTATAAVSRQALPGDLLYPVKRSIETVQYQLARGDSGKGIALLAEASTRLDEVAALMTEDPTPDSEQIDQLDQTFGDFTSESTKGGQLLLAAYANDGDANAIGRIRVFTTEAAAQLRELPEMPPDIGPTFSKAATTVGVLDGIAVRICPDCGGSLPEVSVRGQVPSAALAHALNTFLAENPNLDSHHGTFPGGPTASGPKPSVSSTASGSPAATSTASTTAAGPTASDTSTTEATGAPTATESNQTPAASVPTPADVPTPVPTVQDGEPSTITIPVPKPTAGPT